MSKGRACADSPGHTVRQGNEGKERTVIQRPQRLVRGVCVWAYACTSAYFKACACTSACNLINSHSAIPHYTTLHIEKGTQALCVTYIHANTHTHLARRRSLFLAFGASTSVCVVTWQRHRIFTEQRHRILQSNVTVSLQSNVTVSLQSNVTESLQSNVSVSLNSNVTVSLQSNVTVSLHSNVTVS